MCREHASKPANDQSDTFSVQHISGHQDNSQQLVASGLWALRKRPDRFAEGPADAQVHSTEDRLAKAAGLWAWQPCDTGFVGKGSDEVFYWSPAGGNQDASNGCTKLIYGLYR